MRARKLGLVVGGLSTGAGLLTAILVVACGSSDSETHGFVYDGGGDQPTGTFEAGMVVTPGDDGDDQQRDATTGGGPDASRGDSGTSGTTDAGHTDSGSGGADSGTHDSGTGTPDAGPVDSGPPLTSAHVCDGQIGPGEYGDEDAGVDALTTSTGQTWYLDWDGTNIYVAITTADDGEGAVMYWSLGAAPGTTTGFKDYDGSDPSTLPFAANLVTYFKGTSYSEFRTVTNSAWSTTSQMAAGYKSCGTGTTRELVVPWTVTGATGQQGSFEFFGYLVGGGNLYGQIPTTNTSSKPTDPVSHYFNVANTGFGGSTPFGGAM